MVTLDTLPEKLILEIGTRVEDQADLYSLVRVCRQLHQTLDPELYKRDVRTGSSLSLFWAARFGLRSTLEKAHDAGADLEQAWVSKKSIFPDTCCFSNDQMPTTSFVIAATKRHHIKYFKHSPSFHRLPTKRGHPRPLTSNNPNDNHPPVLKMASTNGLMPYPNNFLVCLEFYTGYSPKLMPRYWWHALDLAVLFRHHDVIRYLLEKGVNVANSHSRGLCCRSNPCHGLDRLLPHNYRIMYPYRERIHNSLTLAACEGDVAAQKMLLKHLGLEDMARDLSRDKVDAHGYRVNKFGMGSWERKVLSTFNTAKAEALAKQTFDHLLWSG